MKPTPIRDILAHLLSLDIALFCDIDGTLVHFVDSPRVEDLHRPPHLLVSLKTLQRKLMGAVAIVTGRPIRDAHKIFPIDRMPIAGFHGLEIEDARGHRLAHGEIPELYDSWIIAAKSLVGIFPGAVLEIKRDGHTRKPLALALHYRNVRTKDHGKAHKAFVYLGNSVTARKPFEVLDGNEVVEIKPKGHDKGRAVKLLMQQEAFRGRVPVFFGDDRTDLDAFAVVRKLSGVSVLVGPRAHQPDFMAHFRETFGAEGPDFYLTSPDDVVELLRLYAHKLPEIFLTLVRPREEKKNPTP